MKTPVRLRVTLVDSHSALVPNSADKILYASEEVTTVKEICNDVREKLGLSQSSYDVQLWSDDYLVPDWTSTTVFQRDEIVQLRWDDGLFSELCFLTYGSLSDNDIEFFRLDIQRAGKSVAVQQV